MIDIVLSCFASLDDRGLQLMFELLNEPNNQLPADRWNRLPADTLAVVRLSNPTREVEIGPVGWNSIRELKGLRLPEQDRHLVVTVHYYTPMQFTHHGYSRTKRPQHLYFLRDHGEFPWAPEYRRRLFKTLYFPPLSLKPPFSPAQRVVNLENRPPNPLPDQAHRRAHFLEACGPP